MLYATHRENESFVSKILRYRTMLSSRNQTWNCGGGNGHGGGRRPRRERKQGKGEIRENARNARGEYCSRSSVMSLLSLPPPFLSLFLSRPEGRRRLCRQRVDRLIATNAPLHCSIFSKKKPFTIKSCHSFHSYLPRVRLFLVDMPLLNSGSP